LYTIALKQDLPLDQTQADIAIDELNDIIKIIETYDID
ncbi:HAD family phosphatase, partial [Colwellia ponticola]